MSILCTLVQIKWYQSIPLVFIIANKSISLPPKSDICPCGAQQQCNTDYKLAQGHTHTHTYNCSTLPSLVCVQACMHVNARTEWVKEIKQPFYKRYGRQERTESDKPITLSLNTPPRRWLQLEQATASQQTVFKEMHCYGYSNYYIIIISRNSV